MNGPVRAAYWRWNDLWAAERAVGACHLAKKGVKLAPVHPAFTGGAMPSDGRPAGRTTRRDHCITSSNTSYRAWVHAVMPNPRVRYSAEKNTPATMRNTNE